MSSGAQSEGQENNSKCFSFKRYLGRGKLAFEAASLVVQWHIEKDVAHPHLATECVIVKGPPSSKGIQDIWIGWKESILRDATMAPLLSV